MNICVDYKLIQESQSRVKHTESQPRQQRVTLESILEMVKICWTWLWYKKNNMKTSQMFSASGPKMHLNRAGQPPQAPSCVQTHTLAPDLAWDTAGMGPALSSGDAHLPIRGLGLALVTWLITSPFSDDQQKLLLSLFPLCLSQAATLPAEAGVTVGPRTVLPWSSCSLSEWAFFVWGEIFCLLRL